MFNNQDKINKLQKKLDKLSSRQDEFAKEIIKLKIELLRLKDFGQEKSTEEIEIPSDSYQSIPEAVEENQSSTSNSSIGAESQYYSKLKAKSRPKIKIDFEKFIGENLINKIGIAITIIGVSIGAKYSIEHDLISPITRIVLGYLTGIVLLGVGIKLKSNYKNYSSVLVSGAIAIMYFITYSAYSFYDLIPQLMAFGLMVLFTTFTVVAALNYNKQVIAHIGLVGAYAVPFLLSDGSGNMQVLFSYMAIINIGILVIAFKKYWKLLYYSSFVITWLVYFTWFMTNQQAKEHFSLAFTFLAIFFIIFYITFLAYKLIKKEKFKVTDVLLILSNSFIFYGVGYTLLNNHETSSNLLGLFTLGNALIHFIICTIIFKQKLADKNLFYLVSGLVLVFITIAIPVQLDGNWVSLLWAGEAALLFWIGRTKNISFYEILSYALMVLAFMSINQDWNSAYAYYNPELSDTKVTPILNVNFLSSLLFIAAFIFINFWNQKKDYTPAISPNKDLSKIVSIAIPTILIFSVYYSIYVEIENYWNQLFTDSTLSITLDNQTYPTSYSDYDLLGFKSIWIINYSLLFVSVLSFANIFKLKNQQFGFVNLALNALAVLAFITQGLFIIGDLRFSYLEQSLGEYYTRDLYHIYIRYISICFLAIALFASHLYSRQKFISRNLTVPIDIMMYVAILFVISSELINWMDIAHSSQSDKLGLSILWGIYALFLIALGIWKKKKHLRIGAIVLFGITLIKLFFYDISHLDTIAKTIVFVSLGVLLLIISFLYNKYKISIADEHEN